MDFEALFQKNLVNMLNLSLKSSFQGSKPKNLGSSKPSWNLQDFLKQSQSQQGNSFGNRGYKGKKPQSCNNVNTLKVTCQICNKLRHLSNKYFKLCDPLLDQNNNASTILALAFTNVPHTQQQPLGC